MGEKKNEGEADHDLWYVSFTSLPNSFNTNAKIFTQLQHKLHILLINNFLEYHIVSLKTTCHKILDHLTKLIND